MDPRPFAIRTEFTLPALQALAYAVALQERFVVDILPLERFNNRYCRPNSDVSEILQMFHRGQISHQHLQEIILSQRTPLELCHLMQQNHRYVLWNFQNTCKRSGTVEFRGGWHLREPGRTRRWATFAVAFVSLAMWEVSKRDKNTSGCNC